MQGRRNGLKSRDSLKTWDGLKTLDGLKTWDGLQTLDRGQTANASQSLRGVTVSLPSTTCDNWLADAVMGGRWD